MLKKATFSRVNMRETLTRGWDPALPMGVFIGANPGKADGLVDDATARKYVGFATRWGWGSYVAGNLFQWVATDMRELIARVLAGEPVNPAWPDTWLLRLPETPVAVCLAWGNAPPRIRGRWLDRCRMVRMHVRYLGVPTVAAAHNRGGAPAHLSRLPYTAAPVASEV
jgi:hypothetical protein